MTSSPERIAYGEHDRIRVGKVAYTCVESNDDGHLLRRTDNPDMSEFFSHAEMARIEKSREYRYDRDWFKAGKVKARQRSGVENFHEIPKREQPRMLWKWEYCDRFRRMVLKGEADSSNAGIEAALVKIAIDVNKLDCAKIVRRTDEKRAKGKPVPLRKDGQPRKIRAGTINGTRELPSYRTLQRWLAILEECDWCIEALRDKYRHCGDRTPRIEPEVQEIMVEKAGAYASQARPSREMQYEKVEIALNALNEERAEKGDLPLPLPSKRRFYTEIAALPKFLVYARRHTLEAAKRKFAGVEDGPMATRIGERIESDEWQVSLQTLLVRARIWKQLSPEARKAVRRARWWLYVAIDRASRCILAMRLVETPRASEAVATLRMIVSDKSDLSEGAGARTNWFMSTGIGALSTDFGSAFYSEETRRVVRAMGATTDQPPASHSWLRGTIESCFTTFESRLMPHFTGRTFSNTVKKGEYEPGKNASIPLDVLARALVRHVVDDYHNRPHMGLGGETPHNAWCRLVKQTGRFPVPDKDTLRAIFGLEANCTLDNSGVTYLGLRYQNRELYDWFTRSGVTQVRVRVDPEDVGHASVMLGEEWVTVPCRKRELDGVSLAVWKETALELRARFQHEAAMSRPIVLAAVRDTSELAREYQREAGIAEELDTPESIEMAHERLGIGFALPEWDEPDETPDGDLLAGVIPVPATLSPAQPQPVPPPPAPAAASEWRMGDRNE